MSPYTDGWSFANSRLRLAPNNGSTEAYYWAQMCARTDYLPIHTSTCCFMLLYQASEHVDTSGDGYIWTFADGSTLISNSSRAHDTETND